MPFPLLTCMPVLLQLNTMLQSSRLALELPSLLLRLLVLLPGEPASADTQY
jgi:hypothetical protein